MEENEEFEKFSGEEKEEKEELAEDEDDSYEMPPVRYKKKGTVHSGIPTPTEPVIVQPKKVMPQAQPQATPQPVQPQQKEVTVEEMFSWLEQRITAVEAAIFRIKGAI